MIQEFAVAAEAVRNTHWDVCVIGAGPVGLCLALNLAKAGRKVVVLEAGGQGYEASVQQLYGGSTDGDIRFAGLTEGRFRGLGGTSTQWGGQILEMDSHIFERREWIEGSGWPISKSTLAPYYQRALEFEGLGALTRDQHELWTKRNVEQPDLGPLLQTDLSQWCPERDMGRRHAEAIATLPGLNVLLHANVAAFELDADGRRIVGAVCRNAAGEEVAVRAAAYALCVGGIETSRLLLQELADGSEAPWTRSALVGRNFHDHLRVNVAKITNVGTADLGQIFNYFSVGTERFHPKIKLAPATQQEHGTLDVTGTIVETSDGVDNISRAFTTIKLIKSRHFDRIVPADYLHMLRHLPYLLWHKSALLRRLKPDFAPRGDLSLIVHCEQSPLTAGHIRLSEERDRLGLFKPHVHWSLSDLETHSILTFAKAVKQTFEALGAARVDISDDVEMRMSEWIGDSYHHLGGAKMGSSEENGVVDSDLRLFAVDNGFVCGTAVFPCSGYANPTHTAIALAERLGDHLHDSFLSNSAKALS